MANVNLNIRLDENLKNEFGRICESMGMSMSTAFNVFAKAVVSERAIPFEVKASDDLLLGPYNSFDEILNEVDEEIYAENLSNK
mgnify:FL=1